MKQHIIKFLALIMAGTAAVGSVSCNDDFELPPMIIPEATLKPTTTIADVKQTYWKSDRNYVETIGLTAEGDHMVIRGRVISSDEAGNIYQNVVIRDESGEALTFAVKTSSSWKLYMSCRFGAEVVIDLTDLKIGAYNGLLQVGAQGTYNNAPSMTFMTEDTFKAHMQPDGLGDPTKAEPVIATLAELAQAKTSAAGLQKWQSQLVRINQVYFKDAGQPFALSTSNNTGRVVANADGLELTVWNSSHSTFAQDLLPQGYGDIMGILSYFGSDWQLLLLDKECCIDFTGEPVTPPTPQGDILNETFESSIGNFTITNVKKDEALEYIWSHDQKYKCMKASAYVNNTSYASESLLISPVIDLTSVTKPVLSFEHALAKFPDINFAKANCVVLARIEGTETWTPVEGVSYPETLSWTFIPSGNVSLAAYAGKKIQIAFSYKSEDGKSGTWEVKNVAVRK